MQQGELLTWLGRPEEGIDWIKKAMRLNPCHPERFWSHLARAYFLARRYSEAAEALHRIAILDVNKRALLTAAHAQLGNEESARASAQKLLDCEPNFRVATHLAALYFKNQDITGPCRSLEAEFFQGGEHFFDLFPYFWFLDV